MHKRHALPDLELVDATAIGVEQGAEPLVGAFAEFLSNVFMAMERSAG